MDLRVMLLMIALHRKCHPGLDNTYSTGKTQNTWKENNVSLRTKITLMRSVSFQTFFRVATYGD